MVTIFITGGTSGIGLEVARLFLADGYQVGVCSFESPEQARAIIPAEMDYYQADVTDKTAVSLAIHAFYQKHQSLDIVVANAGISMPKASIPDFEIGRKVIQVNVLGVLNTFEPAIQLMLPLKKGQLVALGSIAGTNGLPGTAIYGASKAAVINLCEALEIDLADYGIQVTTLAPGFIATPLTQHNTHKMPFMMTQEKAAQIIQQAIIEKKGLYIFPWRMKMVSRMLYHLPRVLYKAFMKWDLLNLRGGH